MTDKKTVSGSGEWKDSFFGNRLFSDVTKLTELRHQLAGKFSGMLDLEVIDKFGVITQVTFGQHTFIEKVAVFAVTADAFFEQMGTLFKLIAAGGNDRCVFAFPERRAAFFAVKFIHAIYKSV